MTVPSEINRAGPYNGNGVTRSFPFGFRILSAQHVRVVLRDNVAGSERFLINGTEYTVSGVGNVGGGSVTINWAPTAGRSITILRNVPFTQETDLENQGAYYAETVEEAFDLSAMRDQQLREEVDRAVKLPPGGENNSELSAELAEGILRLSDSADNIDTVGGSIESVNTVAGSIGEVVHVSQNIEIIRQASGSVVSNSDASFVGDGVAVTFPLPAYALADESVFLWVGGVRQTIDEYSVSGNEITLATAPGAGVAVDVRVSSTASMQDVRAEADRAKSEADRSKAEADRAEGAASVFNSKFFGTRSEMIADAASIEDGEIVYAGGVAYVRDRSATGMNSALWDIGLNGFTALDRPENAYISAFHDLNSPRVVRLYASADGRAFRLLNDLPLPEDEAGVRGDITGGNPVIQWRDGWFYILVQYTSIGNYDFVIYKTRDFTSFQKFQCKAGPNAVSSNTVPAPGASVPCTDVWGADMTISPNGTLDVWITLPFGPSVTDGYGSALGADRRIYRTRCTNLDTLTFSAPVLIAEAAGHPDRVYQSVGGELGAATLPLNHLQTRQSGDGGFDVAFSEFFTSAFPLDNLVFIPCGYGGAGFNNGHWNAGNSTYVNAVNRINAVIAAMPNAVVEGVLWHQGEADKGNANYQANLTSLINRLRTDVPKLAGKPFIMGEIAVPGSGTGVTDPNAVMAAVAASVANTGLVNRDGLVTEGDNLHFAPNSYRALGLRYWKEFKRVRGSVGSGANSVRRIVIIMGQSNSVGWRRAVVPSMIDASVSRAIEGWFYTVKDEILKTIRIYTGPNATGPWTLKEVVYDDEYKIEGSSIVPRRTASGATRYDLFFEGHDDLENVRSTRMMVRRSIGGTPTGWLDRELLKSTRGIRHGTPLNLGYEDPAAFRAFARAAAAYTGEGAHTVGVEHQLSAGNRTIRPQQDSIYYVTGSDAVNLTILDGAADRFWLCCMSNLPSAGIYIRPGGSISDGGAVGFGINNNRMIEVTSRVNGRYIVAEGLPRAAFKAHKNDIAQTISVNTDVAVGFPASSLNVGNFFGFGMFRPPAGLYQISIGLFINGVGDGTNTLMLMRNGVMLRQAMTVSRSGASASIHLDAIVQASAGDEFTVRAALAGSGDRVISGSEANTWFEGFSIG